MASTATSGKTITRTAVKLDYCSYGMIEPGRSYQLNGDSSYHFGFNGQLKTDEIYGKANAYDYDARFYDPRLGRFLAVDPLFIAYPSLSPYSYAANNPILFTDRDGKKIIIYYKDENGQVQSYEYGSKLPPPDNDFVKNSIIAIDYIKESATGAALVDWLVKTDKVLNLEQNMGGIEDMGFSPLILTNGTPISFTNMKNGVENGSMRYSDFNTNSGTLLFDPLTSIGFLNKNDDNEYFLSPATALAHEFGHAFDAFFNTPLYIKNAYFTKDVTDDQGCNYGDPEERMTEQSFEHPIALFFGEGFRKSHTYNGYFNAISPITIEHATTTDPKDLGQGTPANIFGGTNFFYGSVEYGDGGGYGPAVSSSGSNLTSNSNSTGIIGGSNTQSSDFGCAGGGSFNVGNNSDNTTPDSDDDDAL